jgi:hypothetical protein
MRSMRFFTMHTNTFATLVLFQAQSCGISVFLNHHIMRRPWSVATSKHCLCHPDYVPPDCATLSSTDFPLPQLVWPTPDIHWPPPLARSLPQARTAERTAADARVTALLDEAKSFYDAEMGKQLRAAEAAFQLRFCVCVCVCAPLYIPEMVGQ